MTTDLDQLFARERERALPQSHVSLDAAVARGRRRRALTRAGEGATAVLAGAVVVGGGAWALSGAAGVRAVGSASGGSVGTVGTVGAGGSSVATAEPVPTATAATPFPSPDADDTQAPVVGPVYPTGSSEATDPVPTEAADPSKGDGATPPPGLTEVSLPDPAPGFGGRRGPDGVGRTLGMGGDTQTSYWTATFLVGSADASGPQATVMVGDFPLAEAVATPTEGAFPSPTSSRTVRGYPASVTRGSDQIVVSFRTSKFTVMLVGGYGATEDMLVTLAESLRNID